MAWDKTTPSDSNFMAEGASRIRELKEDLEKSFRASSANGEEAIFPGPDANNPLYRYRGKKGTTAERPAAGNGGLYFNTTDKSIYRDSGSQWDRVSYCFPQGTATIFGQASAPIGWTKSTALNDYALRVVSGDGGTFSGATSIFSSDTHTHTIPEHIHPAPHRHLLPFSAVQSGGNIQTYILANSSSEWDIGLPLGGSTDLSNIQDAYINAVSGAGAQSRVYPKTTLPFVQNVVGTFDWDGLSGISDSSVQSSSLTNFLHLDTILCVKD